MSGLNSNTDEGTIKEALYPPPTYSAASRAIMGQKSKTSVQAIRKQVDQRIDQLEDEIRALKTHRNMVSDTSALPPEVLSSIFIILRELTGTGTGRNYYVSAAPWAQVTHVCRHWRAVALDCPALWSDLLFVSPTTTAMMLQRSKNAPLTVKFAANPVLYQDILCRIMSQTGRLREVELRSSSLSSTRNDFLEVLASLTTAPILEKLVLGGAAVSEPRLPEDFLQDGAPSLRHLELTQFAVRWDPLPLSSTLVHLRLQNITSYRPLRKAFLESMSKLLRLETLKLSACLPQSGDVSHPSRSLSVSLPSLRILELQDSVAELCQFFRAAQIPREARVVIGVSDANPQSESLGPLFSALKASWILRQDAELVTDGGSMAQSEILDLRIVCSGYHFSEVKCWFKNHELPPVADDDNPPANLAVSVSIASYNPAVHTPLLTAIAEGFDISSLRTLKIASKPSMPDEAFALFKDLTKLDAIVISTNYYNLTRFLQALKKEGASPGTPSFPALSSIRLHFIDFDELQVGNANTAVCNLIKDLKHREESCPISELSITQCINFSMAHWEALSGSLQEDVEVNWDEDENILEPDSEDENNDWYEEEVWSGMYDDYW
jgi:hypothetical protein